MARENCIGELMETKNSTDDVEEKDPKITIRKRGRPRNPPKPPKEKKKIGRPKDESKGNITCTICGRFFKHHCAFVVHERCHFGIKEFECDYCHKRFVQKTQLEVHRRIHTGEKPFKCPHCPESFRLRSLLNGHIFRHTGQGTQCPQCQSIFPTKAQAKQHAQIVHSTEKPYVCQICGQSYKWQRGLKMHLKNHDKRICAVCGKEFDTMHALMTHRKVHELNHKCSFCDRAYKTAKELQAHTKLRGRLHQCSICCYSFNKEEFLNNHLRRAHWKAMNLEQLRWKTAKPEPDKVRIRKIKAKQPALSSAEPNQCSVEPVQPTPVQPELSTTPNWHTNGELMQPKEESDNQDESDCNQDYGGHNDNETEEVECEPKLEPETLLSEPVDFVSAPKEEPPEDKWEKSAKAKVDSSSDSEEDNVPLAKLVSKNAETKQPIQTDRKTNSPESSEGHDKVIQETKTKRRRRRKRDEMPNDGKAQPVICDICGKSYKSTTSLVVHRAQHGKHLRFKCDECPKAFVYQSHLDNHKRVQHRNERYICAICGKQYKYRVDFRHHLMRHEDPRPFKCDQCPATFTHFTALNDHKPVHRQAVFACTICNKVFRFASSLRVHKRLHDRNNYVRCEVCDKEFSEKAILKKHMLIHRVDRELICVVCAKVYYKKSDLMIHQAKEHPNHPLIGKTIKIYGCNLCSMEFTKDSHLRTHMFIHGTECQFKCDLCENQQFKQKVGLQSHWRRVHHMELPNDKRGKQQEAKKTIDRTVANETVNMVQVLTE